MRPVRALAALAAVLALTACSEITAPANTKTPLPQFDLSASGRKVIVGDSHTCIIRSGNVIECLGENGEGQAPPTYPVSGSLVADLAIGLEHTCALLTNGTIECLGEDDFGEAPATWSAALGTYVGLSAGSEWTCAVRSDGIIECEGVNDNGEAPKTLSPDSGYSFLQVSNGNLSSCAVRIDGKVQCFGLDLYGEAPFVRAPTTGSFVQVSTRATATCALRNDGSIECWGLNHLGQAPGLRTAPIGKTYVQVAMASMSGCALRDDGVVECWGNNGSGQAPATKAASVGSFVAISSHLGYVCGIRTDDLIECWGVNGYNMARTEHRLAFTSTAPSPGRVGSTYNVTASSTGNQTVAFSSSTTPVCTVSSGIVSFIDAGTCTIVGAHAGNSTYFPAPSISQSFSVTGPPAAPSALIASVASATQINLYWTDHSNSETGFQIERRSGATFGVFLPLTSVAANATSYQDMSVNNGDTYQYRIRSCSTGCSRFVTSNQLTTATAPAAPTNLTMPGATASQITLNWTDASSTESRFEVQRRTRNLLGVYSAYMNLANTAANSTAYADNSVTPGYAHQYRIRSCNAAGCSAWLTGGLVIAGGIPTVPSALAGTAASSSSINLTWSDDSDSETHFQLQRRVRVGGVYGAYVLIGAPSGNAEASSDTGLSAGTRYQYRIRACNAAGCSAYATSAGITTLP